MPKKKAFITGIGGQDGSYLAEHLLDNDYEVFGMVRRNSISENLDYKHLMNVSRIGKIITDKKVPTDEEIWA